ncbi:MAG TPA: MarR family transcriptional regulator [Opitutaceae bacterium]|jgi:DNA-binding MarR family transcriptional regulator|nr:MarR family transcriptional regulator [Opitutaceae bacterium]
MPSLLLKEVPKYECLLERARCCPELDPSATEAFLHLMRTTTDVSAVFDAIHASHNISQGRLVVLMLLSHDPQRPANPADLADRSNVTRATMTGLIDTLERDGFVKREHAPDDRRMMSLRLTDEGRAFLDKILPEYFRRIAALMSRLTEGERKTLVALMGKIQQGLPAINAPAKTGSTAEPASPTLFRS